ncbi:MAG: hypothetical protein KAS66_04070 [Candidatus Omnitrophica bacterium]|nr:hypothetical protein [Candidatus Omnitrophota bacterium]
MLGKILANVIKIVPIYIILSISASIAGLDSSSLNVFIYSMVVLLVGIVYGIMLVYKTPSAEFMQMIMEEEKDLKRQENK